MLTGSRSCCYLVTVNHNIVSTCRVSILQETNSPQPSFTVSFWERRKTFKPRQVSQSLPQKFPSLAIGSRVTILESQKFPKVLSWFGFLSCSACEELGIPGFSQLACHTADSKAGKIWVPRNSQDFWGCLFISTVKQLGKVLGAKQLGIHFTSVPFKI